MAVTGPDFISLQVRDLNSSQAFYENYLGLVRAQAGPPHAVVFQTESMPRHLPLLTLTDTTSPSMITPRSFVRKYRRGRGY